MGPFTPNVQFMPFSGSEDLAFDGQGNLAGKNGETVSLVGADGVETMSFADPGPAWGVRFTGDGNLLVAHFQTGVITSFTPDGTGTPFATGIGGVNGLYPDFDGNVWVTDGAIVGRYSPEGSLETIVANAPSSNGIVYDPDRNAIFYSSYGAGEVFKVDITDDGTAGEVTSLSQVGGAGFDGLVLDACGNLYAVANVTARVYRLLLDENAEALGELTDIVDGPMLNVANAQFGRGDGFEADSLYVTGNPGTVYRLELGVPGAPIPLP